MVYQEKGASGYAMEQQLNQTIHIQYIPLVGQECAGWSTRYKPALVNSTPTNCMIVFLCWANEMIVSVEIYILQYWCWKIEDLYYEYFPN